MLNFKFVVLYLGYIGGGFWIKWDIGKVFGIWIKRRLGFGGIFVRFIYKLCDGILVFGFV